MNCAYFRRKAGIALFMLRNLFMEKLRGLDFTMRDYSVIKSEGATQYSGYTITPRRHLEDIIRELNPSGEESFIDIGCGKGFVLSFARKHNFKHVAGIEYSEKLCHIARRNMKRLGLLDVKLYCCDAIEFTEYDEYDVFFFFNPFGLDLFSKVMHEIEESLRRKSRRIKIAYYHPVCAAYFDCNVFFKLQAVLYDNVRKYDTNIYDTRQEYCGEQQG